MVARFLHFIKYNNAFVLGFVLVFLLTGGALAADPDVRSGVTRAVVNSEQRLVSIDNSYLLAKDLEAYTPSVQVLEVTEDDHSYYVTYALDTIDLVDGAWQDIQKEEVLQVSKASLEGRDLGLYVTEQLGEVVDSILARLQETQEIEKNLGESSKVVATAYSGLVGRFLDVEEQVFEGYKPVIEPEEEFENGGSGGEQRGSGRSESGDNRAPNITVLGGNPVVVAIGDIYEDLGFVATDDVTEDVFVDSSGADRVDTSTVGEYTITYLARDEAGNEAFAERVVMVGVGNAGNDSNSTTTKEVKDIDTEPPTIVLNGADSVTLSIEDVFQDEGATANDTVDGDLTSQIVVVSDVNEGAPGQYQVIYSVSDSAGNQASETRTVIVEEPVLLEEETYEDKTSNATSS